VPNGTVKWFSATKGYGFIQPDGGGSGKHVFIHVPAVEKPDLSDLCEGAKVSFDYLSRTGARRARITCGSHGVRYPDLLDDHGGRALRDPRCRCSNVSSRTENNCTGGDD
jgi:CspA family cold shock protein